MNTYSDAKKAIWIVFIITLLKTLLPVLCFIPLMDLMPHIIFSFMWITFCYPFVMVLWSVEPIIGFVLIIVHNVFVIGSVVLLAVNKRGCGFASIVLTVLFLIENIMLFFQIISWFELTTLLSLLLNFAMILMLVRIRERRVLYA